MSNVLEKVSPKKLSLLGIGITVGGFLLSQVGELVTQEQNARVISEMVKEEVARQLNKG